MARPTRCRSPSRSSRNAKYPSSSDDTSQTAASRTGASPSLLRIDCVAGVVDFDHPNHPHTAIKLATIRSLHSFLVILLSYSRKSCILFTLLSLPTDGWLRNRLTRHAPFTTGGIGQRRTRSKGSQDQLQCTGEYEVQVYRKSSSQVNAKAHAQSYKVNFKNL